MKNFLTPKIQTRAAHSSNFIENATPSSGTYPLASCKELENTHTFCPDWIITDTTVIIGQKNSYTFHLCSQINMVRDFTFFSHQIRGSFKAPKLAKFDNL